MKQPGEVAGHKQAHTEIAALVKEAKAQGIDPEFIKKVIASSESHEDTIADLQGLTRKEKSRRPLPPLSHRERELDPHDESIFEEMLAGEHEPETIVG